MTQISLFLMTFLFSIPSFSIGINPQHVNCKNDSDCVVLTLACACIHNSTCSRSTDKENGFVAGANQKYKKNYVELSKCSDDELRSCAVSGPCAMQGEWIQKCVKQKCDVEFKPRS